MSKNPTITLKIDVTKIEKARLFAGKKGTYLDAVLIATPDSKYEQDYMVCQSVSKEERQAGTRGAIIGNASILKGASQSQPAQSESSGGDSTVPF